MINARFGSSLQGEDFSGLGKRILHAEHDVNLAAGFTGRDDRLPKFFKESIPPHNDVWDFSTAEIDVFGTLKLSLATVLCRAWWATPFKVAGNTHGSSGHYDLRVSWIFS